MSVVASSSSSGRGRMGEAIDVVERLASRLGLRRYQVCLAMKSLTAAEDLARSVEAGEVDLYEARRRIGLGNS